MKAIFIILIICCQQLFLFAQKKNDNALINPNLIIYDIIATDSSFYKDFEYAGDFYNQVFLKFNKNPALNLNKILIDKLISNQLIVYEDYTPFADIVEKQYSDNFVKADKSEILKRLGARTDTIYKTDKDGEFQEIAYNQSPDTSSIKALIFYDKWNFNERKFLLSKQVIAYCPVRMFKHEGEVEGDLYSYKKIGYFVFNKQSRKKASGKVNRQMKKIARVEYEFPMECKELFNNSESDKAIFTEDLNSPNWNSYSRQKIRKILVDRVLNGQSIAFDYLSGKELSVQQIKENLGSKLLPVLVTDLNGETKTVEVVRNNQNEDIKSVILIEDWYIDLKTMYIQKRVIGAAPVCFTFSSDAENVKKTIAFVVYFDPQIK